MLIVEYLISKRGKEGREKEEEGEGGEKGGKGKTKERKKTSDFIMAAKPQKWSPDTFETGNGCYDSSCVQRYRSGQKNLKTLIEKLKPSE